MSDRPVTVANRYRQLRFDRKALIAAIELLDRQAAQFRGGCPPGELSLVFLGDLALAKLHDEFLDDPAITDVITFEGEPAFGSAGEICVSVDAALRQAPRLKVSRPTDKTASTKRKHDQAFQRELMLYVVHGWLHLAGYDDLQPAKKREMRRAEARAMALLPGLVDRANFRLVK